MDLKLQFKIDLKKQKKRSFTLFNYKTKIYTSKK